MMPELHPAYQNTMTWMDKVCPDLSAKVREGKLTLTEAYLDAMHRFIT